MASTRLPPISIKPAASSARRSASEYGDDVSDPKQGVSVANDFAGDGVKFVIGNYNSGVTIPSSEVYQENGILEITPASTNPTVTERGMWNIFRVCGRDDQQGRVAGDYILKHFKGKKIAFVNDKTTYGKGLADETLKTIKAGGMDSVLYEGINTGEKDYSALVSKIKQSGADLVYFGGLYTEAGLIVRQMRDQGVTAPLMGGDGITSDEFASVGGPGVVGSLMTYGPDPRNRPEAKAVVAEFRAKNFEPEAYTLYSYAARADHRAGGDRGQFARPEEGRRQDAFRHDLQDRDRQHLLRQEGRYHAARLRRLSLGEAAGRQDHLCRTARRADELINRSCRAPEMYPAANS